MLFNHDFDEIAGETVSLKLIGAYDGGGGELPYYWFQIIPNAVQQPVGKISIRIGSNEHSYYNGNIGYEVDEAYRGHHYAYHACLMVLDIARYHGMRQLYLTCDRDNAPSCKTIERLGGRLLEEAVPPESYIFYYDGIPPQKIYLLDLEPRKG